MHITKSSSADPASNVTVKLLALSAPQVLEFIIYRYNIKCICTACFQHYRCLSMYVEVMKHLVVYSLKRKINYLKALHANIKAIGLLFLSYQCGQYSVISCDCHFYWTSRIVLVTLCIDDPVTDIRKSTHIYTDL